MTSVSVSLRCSACELKYNNIAHPSNNDNIWGFNPYCYNTYREMKDNFFLFVENSNHFDPYVYNEDGYTYTQWYIYYLSKNTYKSKKLYRATLWLFRILSFHPFFPALIRLGKKDDPNHTTLHHFFVYLDQFKTPQKNVLDILLQFGLDMDSEDSEGRSGRSLLCKTVNMKKEDIMTVNQLTQDYKMLEREMFLNNKIVSYIRKCTDCNDEIDKYQDLTTHFQKIKNEWLITMMKTICEKRERCNDIYKKVFIESDSIDRHLYVVEIYKNLLLQNL